MAKRLALMVMVAIVLAPLAGCVSEAELRQADAARCASYGFKPGTNDFAACLQRESLARRYPPPYWDWGPPLWRPYPGPYWWR